MWYLSFLFEGRLRGGDITKNVQFVQFTLDF
jgi:hypothetical protein